MIDYDDMPQEGNDEWYAEVLTKRWYHCTISTRVPSILERGLDPAFTESSTRWLHFADTPLYGIAEMHLFYEPDLSITAACFEVDVTDLPREHVTPGFDDMATQLAIDCVISPDRLTLLPPR